MAEHADIQLDLSPIAGMGLNLDQYFGIWAVDDCRFMQMLESIGRMDLSAHVAAHREAEISAVTHRVALLDELEGDDEDIEQKTGAVAVIDVRGTMTKAGSSLSSAGSTVRLRQVIRNAANDSAIDAILLRIDSPGGTVAGTADLGREVADAAQQKPTWAFVEDLAASAAYWVASQASKVIANDKTAMIGSIGTYLGLYDMSGMAAMEGIKAVVIKAGKHKAAGFPGTEITEEQKAIWQEIIDKTQMEFTAAVARGRKLTTLQVDALADGRVHLAADAQALKLIDGIQTFDETVRQLATVARSGKRSSEKRKSTMAETKTESRAASYAELLVACEGLDPKNSDDAVFLAGLQNTEVTAAQATSLWMKELRGRTEKAKADADAARAKAAEEAEKKAKTKPAPGVDELETSRGRAKGFEGDALSEFDSQVRERMRDSGISRRKAIISVAKSNPELHRAYLEATNPGRKARALIADRFDGE